MMIEIWRTGVMIGRLRPFESVEVSRELNALDSLKVTFPSDICVVVGDELRAYDNTQSLGRWDVKRVEPTLGADNTRMALATCDAKAGVLNCTVIPTDSIVSGATIGDLMAVIALLCFDQTGEVVTISPTAGENLLSADGIETHSRTGVEALRDICSGSGLRWRCRNDLGLVIEYGFFGALQSVTLREANGAGNYAAMAAQNVFVAESVSGYVDGFDRADILVPEGGKWTLAGGQQTPLTLALATPPAGFIITPHVTLAQTYYSIERFGNTGRCWKPILVPNIVPAGDPPDSTQEAEAATTLAAVAARYLSEYASNLFSFTCTIPYSMTGKFAVGDKINMAAQSLTCGDSFQGPLYVATHSTSWAGDNSVRSQVELSSRAESLGDPLSQEYGAGANARRLVQTGSSFTVCGLANPNVVIPFGQTFAVPPAIVPLNSGGVTVTVVAVTVSDVTLSAAPFPNTVCALVYPV